MTTSAPPGLHAATPGARPAETSREGAAPRPELVVDTPLPEFGAHGYLVVDRRVQGSAWGGLRIAPDATLEDMLRSARVMTLKYGWLGIPSGGAKAALRLPEDRAASRAAALRALGRAWREPLQSGAWHPGLDMGCTVEDRDQLLLGAGMRRRGGRDTSGRYTAGSVYCAVRAALRRRGRTPAGHTFAVQGFGRVGSEFARLMEAAGARLVAASTRAGAAWNPRGLAVAELLARRARRGDEFIRELPGGAPLDPQALLELEVDVLVPAAGCGVLHAGNRGRVRAAVVACAANAPMDADTERALTARGVIVVPDFVANCGGILGTTVEPYLDGRRISRLLDQEYRPRVEQLLEAAAAAGATLTELAAAQAEARLAAFEVRGRSGAFRAGRRLLRALPRVLRAPLAYPYCARSLFRS